MIHRALRIGVVTLALLLALEGAFRLLSWVRPLQYFEVYTAPWVERTNPYWETWLLPNARTEHIKDCFHATYASNAVRMRDKPRPLARQKRRVAVLGDSYVEGIGVNDRARFTRVLEDEIFRGEAEFLNFGIQGLGTIQEWLVYAHWARSYHPDVVMVVVDPATDLTDNSWWFWQRTNEPYRHRPFFRRVGQAYELFYPAPVAEGLPAPSRFKQLKNRLTGASYLVRYVNETWRLARTWRSLRALTHGEMAWQNMYWTQPDENWRSSWEFLGEALRRLNTAVRADGASLVVVYVPSVLEFDPALGAGVARQPGFQLAYPSQRLAGIVSTLDGARFVSLVEPFQRYRDAHHLRPPYFVFRCDGHWSPLGHQVVARALADYLVHSGLMHGVP